jgi:hypothetical protein
MSWGILICSKCKREIHQDGPDHSWTHCEDKTSICDGAGKIYPTSREQIKGKFCGKDERGYK